MNNLSQFPSMYLAEQEREMKSLREEVSKLRMELCKRSDRHEALRERILRMEAEQEASDLRDQVRLLKLQIGSAEKDLRSENEYLRGELDRARARAESALRESIDAELLYHSKHKPDNGQV